MLKVFAALVQRYMTYRKRNAHVVLDVYDHDKHGLRTYSMRTK